MPAAPLSPADPALIQLNGETVSPKPNNQPENPRPGATDRIIRFWLPRAFLGRTRCRGRRRWWRSECRREGSDPFPGGLRSRSGVAGGGVVVAGLVAGQWA